MCWTLLSFLCAPLASTTGGCLGRRRVRACNGRPHVQRALAPGRMRLSSITDAAPPVRMLRFTLCTRSIRTKNDACESYSVDDCLRGEITLALYFCPLHPHLSFDSPESFHCGVRPPPPLPTRPPRTPLDHMVSISTHEMTTDAGVSDGVGDARDVVTYNSANTLDKLLWGRTYAYVCIVDGNGARLSQGTRRCVRRPVNRLLSIARSMELTARSMHYSM